MFAKLSRIYHTVKYLKPIQVYYQVLYRYKRKRLRLSRYESTSFIPDMEFDVSIISKLTISKGKYRKTNHFSFLNLEYQFDGEIDWNFLSHGKLWNYNLQYLDLLHDTSIPVKERERLLKDISISLMYEKLRPEPYPVSLRIVNTIAFIVDNKITDPVILKVFSQQIGYLEDHLEYHLLGNHLLENLYTLLISSAICKDRHRTTKYRQLVEEQLHEQILDDGAHYECSVMYHSILLSKLLISIDILEKGAFATGDLRSNAEKMLSWLNTYSFPDGSWALMNDAALGISVTTDELNTVANGLGLMYTKTRLGASGYRKISGKEWEVLIDAGNIIPSYQPGHAHADMLSFCLWYKGMQIIVDQGTSTYQNDQHRYFERSTRAHNTIVVEGKDQTDVWSAFRVGKRAQCSITVDRDEEIQAEHTGYRTYGINHIRKYKRTNDDLIIEDELIHDEYRQVNSVNSLLFNSKIECSMHDDRIATNAGVSIHIDHKAELIDTYHTTHFNIKKPTKRVIFKNVVRSRMRFSFS